MVGITLAQRWGWEVVIISGWFWLMPEVICSCLQACWVDRVNGRVSTSTLSFQMLHLAWNELGSSSLGKINSDSCPDSFIFIHITQMVEGMIVQRESMVLGLIHWPSPDGCRYGCTRTACGVVFGSLFIPCWLMWLHKESLWRCVWFTVRPLLVNGVVAQGEPMVLGLVHFTPSVGWWCGCTKRAYGVGFGSLSIFCWLMAWLRRESIWCYVWFTVYSLLVDGVVAQGESMVLGLVHCPSSVGWWCGCAGRAYSVVLGSLSILCWLMVWLHRESLWCCVWFTAVHPLLDVGVVTYAEESVVWCSVH